MGCVCIDLGVLGSEAAVSQHSFPRTGSGCGGGIRVNCILHIRHPLAHN